MSARRWNERRLTAALTAIGAALSGEIGAVGDGDMGGVRRVDLQAAHDILSHIRATAPRSTAFDRNHVPARLARRLAGALRLARHELFYTVVSPGERDHPAVRRAMRAIQMASRVLALFEGECDW